MREARSFTFDGVSSEDMGVEIISMGDGLFEENFLPSRSIVETKAAKREKPYFQRVVSEPLSFSLRVFVSGWHERENIRQIARWLFTDYYKPMWFETNPDRIYYAIVESDSKLIHNGAKDGYIDLQFRCSSPYTYSNPRIIEDIKARGTALIDINNEGDLPMSLKIWVDKKTADGKTISIRVDNNKELEVKNLQSGENLFIDSQNEELISSLQYLNIYRYGDHNGVWINLPVGVSTLSFSGNYDAIIEYEMIYLAD